MNLLFFSQERTPHRFRASLPRAASQSTDMLLRSHKPDTVIWEDATLSSRSRGGKKLSGSSGGDIGVQVILVCDWSIDQNIDQ